MAQTTLKQIEQIARAAQAAHMDLRRVVYGQDAALELALCIALARAHGLIVGPPGVAKTRLVGALARVLGTHSRRIQFTPDLMPSDITGSEVLDSDTKGKKVFRFVPGPVFAGLVLADEINRASPRTQAALLEAMQERTVTIGGVSHPLPAPFLVFATQNPFESEGVYPLPEAQLDRFAAVIDMGFPSEADERRILTEVGADDIEALPAHFTAATLGKAQNLCADLPVGQDVIDAIVTLVRALRPSKTLTDVRWGPGPRGGQAVLALARARALLDGRIAPSLDDVRAMAAPALSHRIALSFSARSQGGDVTSRVKTAVLAL
jgi:MoxR-like ATPase